MPEIEASRTLLSSWDPENEAKDHWTSQVRSQYSTASTRYFAWQKRYTTGWRSTVAINAGSAVVVLLINVVFTIGVALGPRFLDWQGTLYEGKCSTSRSIGTLMHIMVNVLGTVLLSGSNFVMQVLSAPTRSEVDAAHARSIWLDIGIPSTRNLKYISKERVLLWSCLAFSSLPLHLFYNSAIFSSVAVSAYPVILVDESFLGNASLNNSRLHGLFEVADWDSDEGKYERALVHDMQVYAVADKLDRLDNKACIDAWTKGYQTVYSSLLLVSKNSSVSDGDDPVLEMDWDYPMTRHLFKGWEYDPFQWICQADRPESVDDYQVATPCMGKELNRVTDNPSEWVVWRYEVSHCLSKSAPRHCKICISLPLMLVVIAMNVVKAAIMIGVARRTRNGPLLTIGDAISTYLEDSDPYTKGLSASGKSYFVNHSKQEHPWHTSAYQLTLKRQRWFTAVSRKRWIFCIALYVSAIGLCIFLFIYGMRQIPSLRFGTLWSNGLGSPDPRTFIAYPGDMDDNVKQGTPGFLFQVLVANSPQVILSLIYFSYNGCSPA
ncbi:hypothetical protein BU16DRAFT_567439 [Lophium mytilinum]|uniref:DUF6536 domain-containing protein n=1 Tax=Lophium mytilinum TaxID=390894 RepID=A0A6A6QB04_9PEZI|nr:hypothetical protein BU16DRAFT_567439 [Lophium mytilinum]